MSLEVKIKKSFKDFELNVDFVLDGKSAAVSNASDSAKSLGILGVSDSAKSLGILGASGCGKSMTLKCIAGIEIPDSGRIVLDDRVLFDSEKRINLPPGERRIGYLFQNYALFPTMTVLKNVEAGIRGKKHERRQQAMEMIERMGIADLINRYPDQLSGGQQQRAALARMLAAKPQMILLDEPFSALDTYLRDALQREMKNLMAKFDGHVIMVSHSRDELYRLCSHMAVMDNGRVLCTDSARAVFDNPKSVQAARLTGCKNISEIERTGDCEIYAKDWGLYLKTACPVSEGITHAGIRAHHFRPETSPGAAVNTFPVIHEDTDESPFEIHYFMRNAAAPESEAVWWKVPKNSVNEEKSGPMPQYLSVRPADIMLLASEEKFM